MKGFITVIDFEGTSRNLSPRATEIGLVALDENLVEVASFESLVRPPVDAYASSLAFAHLSREEVEAAPSFIDLWPSIYPFLNSRLLVAHNKVYEIGVINREFRDLGLSIIPKFLCTLEWSRKVLGRETENHQLGTLCSHLGIKLSNAHEALSDARATGELLRRLASRSEDLQSYLGRVKNSLVEYDLPKTPEIRAVVRERFVADENSERTIELAVKRIKSEHLNLIVLTGTPAIGKAGFKELMASYGLENRETPPTKATAFVLRADKSPGMSKIKTAQKYGVPVLLESDLPALLGRL